MDHPEMRKTPGFQGFATIERSYEAVALTRLSYAAGGEKGDPQSQDVVTLSEDLF